MVVISLFSASLCRGEDVARAVAERAGLEVLNLDQIITSAADRYPATRRQLRRAILGPRSFFRRWTRERERCIAYLRATVAGYLAHDELLLHGLMGHLIPRDWEHVLRVCLLAKTEYREAMAAQTMGVSPQQARESVQWEDRAWYEWVGYLRGISPWDPSLYDILLRMEGTSTEEATEQLVKRAEDSTVTVQTDVRQRVEDFDLASRVAITLVEHGHNVEVTSHRGNLILTLEGAWAELEDQKRRLRRLAESTPGVNEVEVRMEPGFCGPEPLPPSKSRQRILLVDDEPDFVRVLSERLAARELCASIAYNGEDALERIANEPPDVMVLDLRMPGVDGLTVLRRVKREHPGIEVIILTGHGSDHDQDLALSLGAFAYLQKPTDINLLTDTMRRALSRCQARSEPLAPHAPREGIT